MVNSIIASHLILTKIFVALIVLITVISQGVQSNIPEVNNSEPDCKYGTEYDNATYRCSDPKCASNTTGIYPNCKCTATNFDYSVSLNKCFRVCPDNSTGYWPNCNCTDAVFDAKFFKCLTCPSNSVSEIYPNCVCDDDNAQFNAQRNYCEFCPAESSGKFPNCICDDGAGKIICLTLSFNELISLEPRCFRICCEVKHVPKMPIKIDWSSSKLQMRQWRQIRWRFLFVLSTKFKWKLRGMHL